MVGSIPKVIGWETTDHPEGNIYFVQDWEPSPTMSIMLVTDLPLIDSAVLVDVNTCVAHLKSDIQIALNSSSLGLGEAPDQKITWDVVIFRMEDTKFGYYIANTKKQTLFWLSPVNAKEDLRLQSSWNAFHGKRALTMEYWRHIEHFPSHRSDMVCAKEMNYAEAMCSAAIIGK